MKATDTEIKIINALKRCRFQPGSFDKKLPREIDINNISPRQQYFIYKLGYKYRKQIGNDILEAICKNWINNKSEPPTRKEAERVLRASKKDRGNSINIRASGNNIQVVDELRSTKTLGYPNEIQGRLF